MNERDQLARPFEEHRTHLQGVAFRMLGSLSEAEDAVQEAWLRLSRADTSGVENLRAWLTTVVARVCLDMLRSRKARAEEPVGVQIPDALADREGGVDPQRETELADSVGLALLVVLETLDPPERLAFVLHDMFGVPFDEIASIVGRSPDAARQLASRARRRVQGAPAPDAKLDQQREVVSAFLAALRGGDFDGLLLVLDPNVAVRMGGKAIRGARNWAQGAVAFAQHARFGRIAMVNGAVGVVMAPKGKLFRALRFTITDGKIVEFEIIADPDELRALEIGVLED